MKTQKENINLEVIRLRKLLSRKKNTIIHVSWNKKKNNKIKIKNIDFLKKKGYLNLIGIVFFNVSQEEHIIIGQSMLLTDTNGKEVCFTTILSSRKHIEITYSWQIGIRLAANQINNK